MKILQQGNLAQKVVSNCWKCGCEFEYATHAATRVHDSRDGDYWQINCPCCTGTVIQQCEQGYNGPG